MLYVTAVRTAAASNDAVTHVRWLNAESGKTGTATVAAMVEWLGKPGNAARVGGEDGPATVGVVNADPPYLRTYADGEWNDNLLAQPRF